jgi:hypothetical protein
VTADSVDAELGGAVSEQMEMFETPQQRTSREHNEALTAWMEARRVESGYQCQACGGIERNDCLFWINHGHMGGRCLNERMARNHTIYDLRNGDRVRYLASSGRLRAVAAWKATQ